MEKDSIKIISWNINQGGGRRVDDQINNLKEFHPNIVALQEVFPATLPKYCEKLNSIGLKYIIDSFQSVNHANLNKPRCYGLLIASEWELSLIASENKKVPWPEKLVSVVVNSPYGLFEVHNVHVPPGSSHRWLKIDTLNAIYEMMSLKTNMPRVLCGDFNTPQREYENGQVITWGQQIKEDGSVVIKEKMKNWDIGERNILTGLRKYDMVDVFRNLNGYSIQEFSWYSRRKGNIIGRRYDHFFASKVLNPVYCGYIHHLRENKLSDHSAIQVVFKPILVQKD